MLSYALFAYGFAFRDADPVRALEALRRGLVIAQDSGNRFDESHLATGLSRLEAEHGDPLAALDHITLAIRNFHDSGNIATSVSALATLAVFSTGSDATNRRPPSPVSRSVPSPQRRSPRSTPRSPTCAMSSATQTYESLARKGETMTTAAMVTYAYDQIDQARTELNAVSE